MAPVHVVFHTHWDREWYLPFAVYRRRLVALIDSLLLALEREPRLRFHLDGQMALVDDYLELRPERVAALRQAAGAGRITLGPWYTLPDEHLVSGEALIRNLELGMARAGHLGRPMLVGYLPDEFGHTAQMPQVLRLLGIDRAVLWRGVPASVGSAVFTWEALDGSAVTALHLRDGYGHAADLPRDPGRLRARLDELVARQRERGSSGPWLVMSGDDHTPVPVGAATALDDLDRPRAAVSSLEDFAAVQPRPGGLWRGELHSAATANVLKGTLSARFPLKLRHAALERRVERYIEPALALAAVPWPGRELAYCWRQAILNSAHDSICGCSIDQVHEQATERLEKAEALADRLWARLGRGRGRFNPSLFEREGVPALGVADVEPVPDAAADVPDLRLEDCPDAGDEYTFEPPPGAEPVRRPLPESARFRRRASEPFMRVNVELENRTTDHRVRLVVPADTSGGAWAGVAFGAVRRPFRRPGAEAGVECDLPTHPARLWVDAGGVAVLVAGPFEYELLEDGIAVTLLRCVGWLSRTGLRSRPIAAGPQLATPDAQMLGRHAFELGVYRHDGDWRGALVPRWAEVFAHPLVAAPAAALEPAPGERDPAVLLSALRRLDGRRQMRTYRCGEPWRIEERWLD